MSTKTGGLPPKLTLDLWEVGEGQDPEGRAYFVIAATPEDAARDKWGSEAVVGRNRGGLRMVADRSGDVVGFIRTASAPIVLPEGYPAHVSSSTIDFTQKPPAAAGTAAA